MTRSLLVFVAICLPLNAAFADMSFDECKRLSQGEASAISGEFSVKVEGNGSAEKIDAFSFQRKGEYWENYKELTTLRSTTKIYHNLPLLGEVVDTEMANGDRNGRENYFHQADEIIKNIDNSSDSNFECTLDINHFASKKVEKISRTDICSFKMVSATKIRVSGCDVDVVTFEITKKPLKTALLNEDGSVARETRSKNPENSLERTTVDYSPALKFAFRYRSENGALGTQKARYIREWKVTSVNKVK